MWTHAGPDTFPNGCMIAEVEVDPETGVVKIDRVCSVDDAGVAINPLTLDGQLHGSRVARLSHLPGQPSQIGGSRIERGQSGGYSDPSLIRLACDTWQRRDQQLSIRRGSVRRFALRPCNRPRLIVIASRNGASAAHSASNIAFRNSITGLTPRRLVSDRADPRPRSGPARRQQAQRPLLLTSPSFLTGVGMPSSSTQASTTNMEKLA